MSSVRLLAQFYTTLLNWAYLVWWIGYWIEKELKGWGHPKSCSQWLNLQMEISTKWCSPVFDITCPVSGSEHLQHVDDSKLRGAVGILEGRNAILGTLTDLRNGPVWTSRNASRPSARSAVWSRQTDVWAGCGMDWEQTYREGITIANPVDISSYF